MRFFYGLAAAALIGAALLAASNGRATAAEQSLPGEIFAPGNRVNGMDAVWLIDEVRGGWVKARLYRTLDDNPAPPHEPRWIYVPAISGSWTVAYEAE